ncbi:hypothetical protein PN836_013735 [Ningiella sp. W23]|uniref:hypothetical protein n=1 Tax=Ningiella sp. W23 TaxID=3023715 RepID=UPI0037578C2A
MPHSHELSANDNAVALLKYKIAESMPQRFNAKDHCSSQSYLVDLSHQQRMKLIKAWSCAKLAFSQHGHDAKKDAVEFHYSSSQQTPPAHALAPSPVLENKDWQVIVPATSLSEFETVIAPKQPTNLLNNLSRKQQASLEQILVKLATRYDNLFMSALGCRLVWTKDETTPSIFARYQPKGLTALKGVCLTHEQFMQHIANLSDIHFKDVLYA